MYVSCQASSAFSLTPPVIYYAEVIRNMFQPLLSYLLPHLCVLCRSFFKHVVTRQIIIENTPLSKDDGEYRQHGLQSGKHSVLLYSQLHHYFVLMVQTRAAGAFVGPITIQDEQLEITCCSVQYGLLTRSVLGRDVPLNCFRKFASSLHKRLHRFHSSQENKFTRIPRSPERWLSLRTNSWESCLQLFRLHCVSFRLYWHWRFPHVCRDAGSSMIFIRVCSGSPASGIPCTTYWRSLSMYHWWQCNSGQFHVWWSKRQ
jgi:hypothetical protein